MNNKTLEVLTAKSFKLISKPTCNFKHFAFILKRNRILSYGYNSSKTNPLSFKYGYRFNQSHAELAAILKFPYEPELLRKCTLVNIRVNVRGELRLSKPCKFCLNLLRLFDLKHVLYSNSLNTFTELW